jgi:hypothetical protein
VSNNLWNPKKFEMFSEHKLAIMKKLHEHPPLVTLLKQYDQDTQWPEMLGEIAAYCNIVVDGIYTAEELEGLEKVLAQELWNASMVLAKTPLVGAGKVIGAGSIKGKGGFH